jgi:hypothetical protein
LLLKSSAISVEFGFRGRFSVVVEADDDFCGILRHLLTAQSNATPSEGSWPRATLLGSRLLVGHRAHSTGFISCKFISWSNFGCTNR